MKIKTIKLVKVNEKDIVVFNSAIEKELFIKTHEKHEYTIYKNTAELNKYICIDTENNGFVLNNKALTFVECKILINMYY